MNIIKMVIDCLGIEINCGGDLVPLHRNVVSTVAKKKVSDVNMRPRAQSAKLRKFATLNSTKERVLRSCSQCRRITPPAIRMSKKEM